MKSYATVVIMAAAIALPRIAHAQPPTPPPVPSAIEVPSGHTPFLAAHAVGTQGYVCVAVGKKFSWAAFGPQATLFDNEGEQRLTHFLSTTPYSLLPNPTWQHSRDSSLVWGQVVRSSSDPNYVAGDAIPWLLLHAEVVGTGPTGGDKLIVTRYIQRVNTIGGLPPATGCAAATDIKKRELVPYEADYFFFRERARAGEADRD